MRSLPLDTYRRVCTNKAYPFLGSGRDGASALARVTGTILGTGALGTAYFLDMDWPLFEMNGLSLLDMDRRSFLDRMGVILHGDRVPGDWHASSSPSNRDCEVCKS